MKHHFTLLCFLGAFLTIFSGCSNWCWNGRAERFAEPVVAQVPVPTGYPLNTQMKMQAAHHWNLLASNTARRTAKILGIKRLMLESGVYVVPSGTTPFEKAFRELLITHLVENGIRVTDSPENQVLLSTDLQIIRHHRRIVRAPAGMYRSFAPGLFLKADQLFPLHSLESAENSIGMAKVNVEAGVYTVALPSNEVIITTSLVFGGDYLARNSAIYYIDDPDWWHYEHRTREPMRPPVVTYRLTAD